MEINIDMNCVQKLCANDCISEHLRNLHSILYVYTVLMFTILYLNI